MISLDGQKTLFPDFRPAQTAKTTRTGTFTDNMKLPVHRWFRYSAGFSGEWAFETIKDRKRGERFAVLDPFAGSGTSLLAADAAGVKSHGFETHPFIFRIARAKLNREIDCDILRDGYRELSKKAQKNVLKIQSDDNQPVLLKKCFSPHALQRLEALKAVYLSDFDTGSTANELIWLGITAILRACSDAGTAQWQYVLPNKKKANVAEPFHAFATKMEQIIDDIRYAAFNKWTRKSSLFPTDARISSSAHENIFDFVITSPPYPNNYDYADATRLEMTFWGDISGWKDLQSSVRRYLIRSCSQHSAAEKLRLDELLRSEVLSPIHEELSTACRQLEKIRLTKGGKKTYHTMAAAYFMDMANVFLALRSLCKPGSELCFVIGDSAPYGVYLAVDRWLGELALAAGFKGHSFEKIRDRNTKWKNRKHNVPLHEGRLWIEG